MTARGGPPGATASRSRSGAKTRSARTTTSTRGRGASRTTSRPASRTTTGAPRRPAAPAPDRARRGERTRPRRPPAGGGGGRGRARAGDPRTRALGLLVAIVVLFGAVVVRLAYVQVVGAERYVAYGDEQRIRPIDVAGGRGSIFDRNGEDLAISIPRTTIAADPSVITQPTATAHRLAPVLHQDEAKLRAKLRSQGRFVYLARQVDDRTAHAVKALHIPGVLTFAEQARFNPAGDVGRALLGEVGVDNTGLSGVEKAFDGELSGRNGKLIVERDLEGRTIPAGRHQIDPAVPGDDLVLTIDGGLQYTVEGILANQINTTGARGGIAIVSNPETGEVLAMANEQRDPRTNGVGNSSNDLAVTANYEPGSVNKLITLSAAIEEGVVTPDTVINVPSALRVADHTYYDSHAGNLTVTDVLAKSSNVGTIEIAQQLGPKRLEEYLRRFGFGHTTGLGLPHEEKGQLLPLDEWSGTSIGSIPIGQGISVTAMQMLYAYNVIANDGVYVPPTLVRATVDEHGKRHATAPRAQRRVVSPTTAAEMRAMLTQVIASGTGRAAAIEGYDAAGKTGTARKPQPGGGYKDAAGRFHYISTFAGFLPAEDPKLSVIIVIDEPTTSPYAAQVAAPAFADIGRNALRLLGVAPTARPPAPLAIDGPRVRATAAPTPTTVPPSTTTTRPGATTATTARGATTTTAPRAKTTATTVRAGPPPGD
ncbi:MAG TPA: penicillin-binding protein 2 [Acidimicrobiales bacterium]|nr:penicillin-binding protein 2 [Acidimicrobiales bacterium]